MSQDSAEVLAKILDELTELKIRNAHLEAKVDALHGAATLPSPSSHARRQSSTGLSPLVQTTTASSGSAAAALALGSSPPPHALGPSVLQSIHGVPQTNSPTPVLTPDLGAKKTLPHQSPPPPPPPSSSSAASSATASAGETTASPAYTTNGYYSSRVILTTYPGQVGIKPLPLAWGASEPRQRGPVVASRHPNSIKVRNAIGAYGGSYSVYRSLAVAMGQLNPNHRPDYTNTEPPFDIPPNPSWFDRSKIVAMDPWGHLAPQLFRSEFDAGIDIRPTASLTKAHIKMPELDTAQLAGTFPVDGKVVVKSQRLAGVPDDVDPGCEVNVSKAAVDPVWYLPGVADRLGVTEGALRRAIFEDTGGSYPELLTRHDLKVFLPPISGLTVYIFGRPEDLRDPAKEVTVRIHDECNGSDVFGSDICTCRPYLLFGIEECIKTAQRGGAGAVIYFRKEGRALGEVTKYLVYNARKRGTDTAANYFRRTEDIAGVKDMRMQALMPDVLHWLGATKIDNWISMSDMKYRAAVDSGITIINRYELPESLIPADGRVEIDAKIEAGYFSGKKVTEADLKSTIGRHWEDVDH
ncbi:uncharacterized protein PFL1_06269 [Pseudozyma flocculosa PF-1]|uniref:Related to bifunctional GTP cyclohydrolase II/3, 4-dihydroxy-2butanone-4-phosphate synthase n=2 Tax=Pseudozyma flocculosa TaxID=84751 RepID=A0A5C3F759_9BASI|nr:uncharacterized protein PFL1_06269 [Pseudozyma flocculosa PF-1]EPQ26061.1 hypothetical protein PFL1_06269 [Pseudozyma flocculosa PF-1]SPO40304.1 related to bifunctional GTP cyclohydrolase II/3, 4-dihydroxy-2butanone-4-phosphate synthase [Pseudozyma flocculosa]